MTPPVERAIVMSDSDTRVAGGGTTAGTAPRADIYWHRQLPPADAEVMDEHVIEASSGRVQGSLAHRDELWDRCYAEVMDVARRRLTQEIGRLGGDYAHVLGESIEGRHDDATNEAWLHGRFTYVLSRRRKG